MSDEHITMTPGEALVLAKQWKRWRTCADRLGENSAMARSYRLSKPKSDRLREWVARAMAEEIERRLANSVAIVARRNSTGPLCRADGLRPDDSEALANHIGHLLGGDFRPGLKPKCPECGDNNTDDIARQNSICGNCNARLIADQGLARSLCEWTGWPS